jgi:hypothetical protein
MKRAIDSVHGRRIYSQRIAIVEPVFANIRHNKRLNRFTLREGEHSVAAVLPGAQHRETRAQRLSVKRGQSRRPASRQGLAKRIWDARMPKKTN